MSDDGWGRRRPNFADLLPSTPSPECSSDDGQEPMATDDAPVEDPRPDQSQARRVVPLRDHILPRFDGVPIAELHQTYANEGLIQQNQLQGLKKFYTAWSNGDEPHKLKFTCVFTCPVTGEHFACGHWKNEKGVTVENDVEYWYGTKKFARVAAACRALDCFSLRRCHGTGKAPSRRCLDEPYLAGNAPKLPDLPSGVVLPTALPQGNKQAHVATPPKRALHDWYISFSKRLDSIGIVVDEAQEELGPRNESYNAWSNNLKSPNTLFTAIFTCHLSGERFASGSIIGEEDACKDDFCYYDVNEGMLIPRSIVHDTDDAFDSDGFVESLGLRRIHFAWYKTKKKAMAAAAARAVDCLKHRDSLHDTICDNRYCKEDPYTVGNAPELWKHVSESVSQVGGNEWVSVPHDGRLTTRFGVPDLHSLLEGERSEEYWRAKYRERRNSTTEWDHPLA